MEGLNKILQYWELGMAGWLRKQWSVLNEIWVWWPLYWCQGFRALQFGAHVRFCCLCCVCTWWWWKSGRCCLLLYICQRGAKGCLQAAASLSVSSRFSIVLGSGKSWWFKKGRIGVGLRTRWMKGMGAFQSRKLGKLAFPPGNGG